MAILGDSITTDHISPAGSIKEDSPAGKFLKNKQVSQKKFNSYGSRRGSHDVMIRGTFANVRLRNKILPEREGGVTKLFPDNKEVTIYEAAKEYQNRKEPLVIFAGKEYGTGSSRDWAAKGTRLLGVRAVIAESFERIHRSNLVGMGVLPIQLETGLLVTDLGLSGAETIDIDLNINVGGEESLRNIKINITYERDPSFSKTISGILRIDTQKEFSYVKKGNILNYVLEELVSN